MFACFSSKSDCHQAMHKTKRLITTTSSWVSLHILLRANMNDTCSNTASFSFFCSICTRSLSISGPANKNGLLTHHLLPRIRHSVSRTKPRKTHCLLVRIAAVERQEHRGFWQRQKRTDSFDAMRAQGDDVVRLRSFDCSHGSRVFLFLRWAVWTLRRRNVTCEGHRHSCSCLSGKEHLSGFSHLTHLKSRFTFRDRPLCLEVWRLFRRNGPHRRAS